MAALGKHGFIHDKLEIKFLILYLLSRTVAPVNFSTLTELTLCDDGVEYFDFAECVHELVETEHLTLEDNLYAITEKGRRNGEICESGIAYSVRLKCEKNLAQLNTILRRNAQVRAQVLPRDDGFFTLRMVLDDEKGNILTVEMLTISTEQGERLGERFRAQPEQVYNGILNLLTGDG